MQCLRIRGGILWLKGRKRRDSHDEVEERLCIEFPLHYQFVEENRYGGFLLAKIRWYSAAKAR